MKNILVPTDFSPCADAALNYALELAKKTDAEIILLHCCELFEPDFSSIKELVKEHNASLKKELYGQLNFIKEGITKASSLQVTALLYGGGQSVPDSILEAALHHSADLIIMGTEGATGLTRRLFGTKTAAVINNSRTPVLTIPPHCKWSEPKSILLAIEEREQANETLQPVFELASLFGANICSAVFTEEDAEVFEVLTHTRNLYVTQKKLQNSFAGTPVEFIHLTGKDFHGTLQEFVAERHMDMLAMITHKRNFLQNIFNSSRTQKMSYLSRVPLLSLQTRL
ncbi:universal stress protein [Paraflavisolibacter sp. H34]|uniref:universal stress protein n=1 Tax=Huijunlia imazamoxiresistens TaxID=3127457 RepID=UPI003018F12B